MSKDMMGPGEYFVLRRAFYGYVFLILRGTSQHANLFKGTDPVNEIISNITETLKVPQKIKLGVTTKYSAYRPLAPDEITIPASTVEFPESGRMTFQNSVQANLDDVRDNMRLNTKPNK